ncbi:MAG: nucleotidyltransferase family protein [Thermodesulfobacteriota bacterium]
MEREFLIKLCRPERGLSLFTDEAKRSRRIGTVPAVPKGIDWNLVSDMAEEEGLSGVVYILIRGKEGIPPEVLEGFQNRYYTNVMNNLFLFNSLKPVLECLESNDIIPVVFRGASLMGGVYSFFGMRSFQDIDLLIREVDLFKTINLLKKEGFYSCDPYISVLCKAHLNIDLHTDFMTYSRVKPVGLAIDTDLDSIFERAMEQEVQGLKFLTLHPEDGILSLAVHLQMHSFDRLLGFLDIARIIDHYRDGIDWERLFERARSMNLERTLYYSLSLMPEEWRGFDGSVIERLGPHFSCYGEEPLLGRLRKGERISYSGDILFLLNTKGIWNKMRFLKGCLLPKEEVGLRTLFNPLLLIRFLAGRLIKIGKLWNLHAFDRVTG